MLPAVPVSSVLRCDALASADGDPVKAASAKRELADSTDCKSIRPCSRHSWTQGAQNMFSDLFLSLSVSSTLLCLGFLHSQAVVVSGSSRFTERWQRKGSGYGLWSETAVRVRILSLSSFVALGELLSLSVLQCSRL